MKDKDKKYYFERFLEANCQEGELEEVQRFLADEGNSRRFADLFMEVWRRNKSDSLNFQVDSEELWGKIQQEIYAIKTRPINNGASAQRTNNDAGSPTSKVGAGLDVPTYPSKKFYWAVAAVISVLLAAGLWVWPQFSGQQGPVELAQENEILIKSTLKGEKLTFSLPDGSRVKLNGNSSITFPRQFDGGRREVVLNGEAWFEVVSDPGKPFTVRSPNLEASVLGTSFNMVDFNTDNKAKIALATGKVVVRDRVAGNELELKPDYMASYDKEKGQMVTEIFDHQKEIGWVDGILVFSDDSFPEVLEKLELWYGVEFEIKGFKPEKEGFKGEFDNKSLNLVLMGLSKISGFRYEIKDKKVIIY